MTFLLAGSGWANSTPRPGASRRRRRTLKDELEGQEGEGLSLEARLRRLEEIVGQLEAEELELDRALALFEEGVVHVREAERALCRGGAPGGGAPRRGRSAGRPSTGGAGALMEAPTRTKPDGGSGLEEFLAGERVRVEEALSAALARILPRVPRGVRGALTPRSHRRRQSGYGPSSAWRPIGPRAGRTTGSTTWRSPWS